MDIMVSTGDMVCVVCSAGTIRGDSDIVVEENGPIVSNGGAVLLCGGGGTVLCGGGGGTVVGGGGNGGVVSPSAIALIGDAFCDGNGFKASSNDSGLAEASVGLLVGE
jgi:hypothetical protein